VLIVDDDPGVLVAATRLLVARGFDVVGSAETGAAALDAVEDLRPDAVLLDIHLPDTDGYSVARAIADSDGSTRVVLMSSDSGAGPASPTDPRATFAFIEKADLATTDFRQLFG
jgi:DNA-binding NarL/FixJ family response regulator